MSTLHLIGAECEIPKGSFGMCALLIEELPGSGLGQPHDVLELQVLLEFTRLVRVQFLGFLPVDQLGDPCRGLVGGPEGRDACGIGACDQIDLSW